MRAIKGYVNACSYVRCSTSSTRRLPFVWRETLTNPLTSSFMSIRFNSRKLRSSLPFRISRNNSSSVIGPFRPIKSITESCRGLGPQTLSIYEHQISLGYWGRSRGPFSPKSLGEVLVPSVHVRSYAGAHSFHRVFEVAQRDVRCFDIAP